GRVSGLLPASDTEAATAITGTGTDAAVCAGQGGGDPNGRLTSADDRRPHRHSVALHRTRARSGAAASDAEAQCAGPTATKDLLRWSCRSKMTSGPVCRPCDITPQKTNHLPAYRPPVAK